MITIITTMWSEFGVSLIKYIADDVTFLSESIVFDTKDGKVQLPYSKVARIRATELFDLKDAN